MIAREKERMEPTAAEAQERGCLDKLLQNEAEGKACWDMDWAIM
jgi:hypothetical protein